MFDETFPLEFIGGSRDGEASALDFIPEYIEVKSGRGWIEVYERQNEEPPFIYVQIGYAKQEQWS